MFSAMKGTNERLPLRRKGRGDEGGGALGETRGGFLRIPWPNTRAWVLIAGSIALAYLLGVLLWGVFMDPSAYAVNYADKFLPPDAEHPFGTDFMGRDMFRRCVKGLSTSLSIGVTAAVVSSVIGLALGILSAVIGRAFDKVVLFGVDLCMGLPHLVLLILISFMLGRGEQGVLIGIALTHWPELTRVIRAEVLQLRSAPYVQAAYRMGKTRLRVAWEHIIPHVIPVYLVGVVLLFPHAIMHEASLTFLGFGLPMETPAIGVILAEAMQHIATGKWWLALFPGLMLLAAVVLFDIVGDGLKKLLNPHSGNL